MPTALTKTFVPLAAAVLLLASCGGSDQEAVDSDPEGVLEEALENLADYEGLTVELSVESTTDSLTALSEGSLTEEQAQQILDSSVQMSSKEYENPEDQQFELAGNIAGQANSFELKALGTTYYVRADVQGLVETFGGDSSELAALEQQYGGQPDFEFIGALLDGDWVAMTGAEQFLQQMTGGSIDSPTGDQAALAEKLAESIKEGAEVEAGNKDGPGGHLIVSLNVRDVFSDFKSIMESAGSFGGQPMSGPDEIPNEELMMDMWVSDEQVTQVELDLTQFAEWEQAEDFPEGVDDLRLRIAIEEFTGEVEEPEAAAEVDVGELAGLLLRGAAGAGESAEEAPPVGNDALCDEIKASLEGQPDEVVEQAKEVYGAMCPNL